MERASNERGGTSTGNQPRGGLPMATSIFTEHAVRSVHDGDVIRLWLKIDGALIGERGGHEPRRSVMG
jgi:hypothetical protein